MHNYSHSLVLFSIALAALTAFSCVVSVSPAQYEIIDRPIRHERVQIQLMSEYLGVESLDIDLIQQYSKEFNVDYKLIIALIKQESQFDCHAVSERGAAGLMQIMPVTRAEISEKLSLQNIHLPTENLRAGIYYLSNLYDLFEGASSEDRTCLTLAAYNAGPSRIYDAQELSAYLGENPSSWAAVQKALPLLSKRCYTLHQSIWGEGKPRSGYFGSFRQTTTYVDNVMKSYHEYQEVFD